MPECPGCGASYIDDFKFCPHCGRAKPEPPKIHIEVLESPSKLACPVCGRVDQVQKLSAIHIAGTNRAIGSSVSADKPNGHSAGSVGTGSLTAIAQTELARQVSPPVEPAKPALPQTSPRACRNTAVLAIAIIVFVPVVGIVCLAALGVSPESVGDWIVAAIYLFAGIVAVVGSVAYYRRERNLIEVKRSEQDRAYGEAHMKWKQAHLNWERMYYCHRDSVVYVPGTSSYETADKANEYAYRLG